MKNTKDISWLQSHYTDQNIRIIDCRFKLGEPSFGKNLYDQDHIPGAVYFDLENDLSGAVKEHGGRHPLPDIADFVQKLEQAGIENNTTVITYDNGEGAFSARCWWLLKYIGHEKAYILDEGYQGWIERELPTTSRAEVFPSTEYEANVQQEMIAAVDDVRMISTKNSDGILIDSRASDRYRGLNEPIDRIPGHIPGAVNSVWTEGLKDGRFLPAEEQQKRWAHLDKGSPLVVYCGSGVTATPNILSLWEAGFTNVKLYPGSYSDWVSYEDHEVETSK
jgi:thiosulfate/3-mercaptopyruvate sulfurtransferase